MRDNYDCLNHLTRPRVLCTCCRHTWLTSPALAEGGRTSVLWIPWLLTEGGKERTSDDFENRVRSIGERQARVDQMEKRASGAARGVRERQ
jgi:hypothetical protein